MKRPATFKQISRLLMDSWISSPDGLADPESLYGPFRGMLRANMILLVINIQSGKPEEFHLDFIKGYDLPTGFASLHLLQRRGSLSDFPDQHYLQGIVVPAYADAAKRQRPAMRCIVTRILDMHVAYDRIILPQKNSAGLSSWCIGLLDIRFLLPTGPRTDGLDDADLAILQLLAEGASTREVATAANLSARTIEHRIERLKSRFRARNITQLVVLAISAGIASLGGQDF
ncbi:helix-turn-helix transcriptional regulator [Rhizobium sp. TRM95111]|uniref:response regulator transcription factor n=1 Tax=Rhizobium alarense TaxID=2846851 RepID=UPI001F22D1DB|nr:helix-turn-helix transcriptional regulator [Rhizobium alarense]MCF3638855.1 helix-turn-helix transcriptional regulator [Rhizobium alarense]